MARDERSSLVVELRPGDRIVLSGAATVELEAKSGQLARLRVSAPRNVKIEKQQASRPHVASMV